MNTDLIVEIVQLAASLAEGQIKGTAVYDEVERTLLSLVEAGIAAYHQHTGQPIDISQILPEAKL